MAKKTTQKKLAGAGKPNSLEFWNGYSAGIEDYEEAIRLHGRSRALVMMREACESARSRVLPDVPDSGSTGAEVIE